MDKLDIEVIKKVFQRNEQVVFVYLYGSFTEGEKYRDLDFAIYSTAECDAYRLSTDLKIALSECTGISPDFFDVRIINRLVDHGDLFSLLYLKQIFETDELLIDKNFDLRADFIEKYSMKYRECEGLINEMLL